MLCRSLPHRAEYTRGWFGLLQTNKKKYDGDCYERWVYHIMAAVAHVRDRTTKNNRLLGGKSERGWVHCDTGEEVIITACILQGCTTTNGQHNFSGGIGTYQMIFSGGGNLIAGERRKTFVEKVHCLNSTPIMVCLLMELHYV